MPRARRSCAKCCSPICPKSIATTRPKRFPPEHRRAHNRNTIMARRKEAGHGGGHGWFVTFADLMGLLVAFFVMLVAFSTQDKQKLQIVAGSMREAFGVQTQIRYSGISDVDGPSRPKPMKTTR